MSPDDPLFALLDTFAVEESDIEQRVLLQLERDAEQESLRAEVAQLRAQVDAMRAEMAELRQLLTRKEGSSVLPGDTRRGKPLLPYVKSDDFSLLPDQSGRN